MVLPCMYLPLLTAGDVHVGVASDQGFAKELDVLLQPIAPGWFVKALVTPMTAAAAASAIAAPSAAYIRRIVASLHR